MHYLYIIYSEKIDRFYIGESEDVNARLIQHNEKEFKNAFTSQANDWTIKCKIEFENIIQARKAEAFVKKMKSKKFNEALINDHAWFIEKFSK